MQERQQLAASPTHVRVLYNQSAHGLDICLVDAGQSPFDNLFTIPFRDSKVKLAVLLEIVHALSAPVVC